MGSDTRTGSIPVCGTIKSSDSYESELFFHSPPKILRRSALADPAPSPVPTTSLAAARPVVLRDAQGSGGKAGEKRRKNGGLSTDTGIIRQESLMLSQLRMP